MIKKILLFVLLFTPAIGAVETIVLTTPVTKSITTVRIQNVNIDIEGKSIYITWLDNNGETGNAQYTTPPPSAHPTQPSGATLLTQLNKLNFSAGNPSLVNRILTRLQTDGYIGAGSTSGTPD